MDAMDWMTGTWCLTLLVLWCSAALLRWRSLAHLRLHGALTLLPALLALVILAAVAGGMRAPATSVWLHHWAPGWLMASLILSLAAVIQRFGLRFLLGDSDQGRALFGLSQTTIAASLCWLMADTRLLLLAWGVALWSLLQLIGLTQDWQAVQRVRWRLMPVFALAWLALAGLLCANGVVNASWQVAAWQPNRWPVWMQHAGAALLLLAALIPAAQWPFQRWLMNSMVASTPVSAIMHAGLVNAGAVMLALFGSALTTAGWAQPLLMLMACGSILLGTGMGLVQVDVKRQLAASTVAQMGAMLLQCALGAYAAAITHLVLHAGYKASLFLHAGGALQQPHHPPQKTPFRRQVAGALLLWLVLAGLSVADAPFSLKHALSALILGSALCSVAVSQGARLWQWRSLLWLAGLTLALVSGQGLSQWLLGTALQAGLAPPATVSNGWIWLAPGVLTIGTLALEWLRQHPQHVLARWCYWQLVAASEADRDTIDPHPAYLARRFGVMA